MHVAVTGSTGMIGSALVRLLVAEGHAVTRLTRSEPRSPSGPVREARWDPAGGTIDAGALVAADAVVHLAGKGIASGRWTEAAKREIRESRVRGTGLLARTMAGLDDGPRVLVSASGIHYYGDRDDEVLTERSRPGGGFLAEVCQAWEDAADPARAAGLRVVHVRTGITQTREGGSLPKQLPLFRLGLGGRFGSGRQWWSWVSLDDVLGIYRHALVTDGLEGTVNATAPNPVTNAEFTATLARVLGRPALAPVPRLGPRLVLGEMAEELLFYSIRVQPEATLASGYTFRWPELEPALRHLLNRPAAA
ncbi:MAG TPA: TIGR01777 family oxidoreductase [Actinomycetes bacterium]|jgi:uncharacterized protein (TIGR01777 family)|nr:TIGR01777 family oxidoreductase [Actinomycetes bacterium]